MDTKKLRKELENRLKHPSRQFIFEREKDQLRIENIRTGQGITVELPGIVAKWHEQKDKAIDEVVYFVEEGLRAMGNSVSLTDNEQKIFPVIRSTSFPTTSKDDVTFVFDEHTAETRIYYALDLGNSYRLIDEQLLLEAAWSVERVREIALFNVRTLQVPLKEDEVAGNKFYFIRSNDGYDASRILNQSFLKEMEDRITGTMAVAVPHQDVLIIADIQNDTGYDVLAHMTMSFFASGRVPITALSFIYEAGELEPIFIMAKNKKK
ncbi:DUF1444 domain-containing protein [Bacillus marasmi]|uniref:DUF1444 domain-containing protein n=1 Tax=Bacillus marasmi TaxID=1926279 RepID=UPI0011CB758D|nr:DUF1444 domain-containing protein [Bacillus marasmi]